MLWSLGPKILTHSFQQFLTFFIELALSFSHELDEEILEPVTTLFPLLGSIHNSSLALFCLHHPTICSTIHTGFHYPPPRNCVIYPLLYHLHPIADKIVLSQLEPLGSLIFVICEVFC